MSVQELQNEIVHALETSAGGGVGGARDSLHEFKRRFDPGGELPMAIGKAVHDSKTYSRLGGNPADVSGFFPAYRG